MGLITLRFQPRYIAEMADLMAIHEALADFAPRDAVGELWILSFSEKEPVQISLIVDGTQPVHTKIEAGSFYSAAHWQEVRQLLQSLFEALEAKMATE